MAKSPQEGDTDAASLERAADRCPYCDSTDFVKRGTRKNKHQRIQLYVCRNPECARTFSSRTIKGKHFPWPAVLDAISYHNLGYTFPQCSQIVESRHGVRPQPDTIASWYEEYEPLCRFARLRPYAMKILSAWRRGVDLKDNVDFYMVETTTLAHRQLYRFRYHRPKLLLLLEEYRNREFGRLMEYLDIVSTETPHQFFADGARMSEVKSKFDKANMIVKRKQNFANTFTDFVLQAVPQNKDRHEILQRFMIANDSVTVATEVPVYIRKEDVVHFETKLGFTVAEQYCPNADVAEAEIDTGTGRSGKKGCAGTAEATSAGEQMHTKHRQRRQRDDATSVAESGVEGSGKQSHAGKVEAISAAGRSATDGYITMKGKKRPQPFPDLMTGHIDIVQVRNGVVHILDYKPNADKEKPIEQLTWYALALSRLTGLRLFSFKCAWFDEHNYYEFYPLHVVKKLNRKRRKKVRYRDGTVAAIPNENELHIIR